MNMKIKVNVILLFFAAISFGSSKISFLFKYDYGLPLEHTYLGQSVIKPTTDTFDIQKKEYIYGSFGKGNKLSLGIKLKYVQNIPFLILMTYQLPSKILIERKLQEYDDSDIWEYSYFSINTGLEMKVKYFSNNYFYIGFYPGLYIPNYLKVHGYNTITDNYYNVISGYQEKYHTDCIISSNVGFLASIGFEQFINNSFSLVYSFSPEIIFLHSNSFPYNNSKVSFSSLRISLGLLLF